MKKFLSLALIALTMVGCANAGSGAIGGTAVGAGAGALVGQALGKNTKSTLIGASAGAALGAVVGTMQDRNRIEADKNYVPPDCTLPQNQRLPECQIDQ